MQYALVNITRQKPQKGLTGQCPLCKARVVAKCGDINTHHWAHKKGEACEDTWHEKETAWHLSWKYLFPEENTEVVITKEGKRHFADIQTKDGVVIEIQNSPIKPEVITEREEFYGEKMLWIINGLPFRNNFDLLGRTFNATEIKNRFLRLSQQELSHSSSHVYGRWQYPRKTWKYAKRPVFIDFGDECLYRITEGLGTSRCSGMAFSKRQFIEKYGGDFEIYKRILINTLDFEIEEEKKRKQEENRRLNMKLRQMGW